MVPAAPRMSNMHSPANFHEAGQANMVHEVEVSAGGKVWRASYFVEDGVIVAVIGTRTYRCPVGSIPASDTVRALLTEVSLGKSELS